jgi:succinate-acetate transporter protein
MSTPNGSTARPAAYGEAPAGGSGRQHDDPTAGWAGRTRIVLTPIAAPSILGLFGFAGATLIVAAHLAGWYGTAATPALLAPFAAAFGGLAQFVAGVWCYRARDALGTAMHGTWGAFWIGFGLFALLIAAGVLPASAATSPEFGMWFVALCIVTAFGAIAATGENLALFIVLGTLAAGSGLLAAGMIGAVHGLIIAGGWVLVASAAAAFYTAGAMMLEQSFTGHVVLPLGRWSKQGNLPGHQVAYPVEYPAGMPGAKVGQ